MTDKIRIVGEFGADGVERLQEFVKNIGGVAHVEFLRNGVELYGVGEKKEGVPVTETPADDAETPAAAEAPKPKRSRARASK